MSAGSVARVEEASGEVNSMRRRLDVLRLGFATAALRERRRTEGFAGWIHRVGDALRETNAKFPFLAYGTDWLAFGHVVIAVAFVGAWRDPVRNKWLFQFGMIACVAVVPWALAFGEVRGIPLGWRLIDCAFGVVGFFPMWLCWRLADEVERRGHTN